jgi:hypothetical protein
MKCEQYRDRISEYIDRDMPEHERKDMQRHIEKCDDCRNELRNMDTLSSVVDALPRYEPGTKTILDITSAIHAPFGKPPRTGFGPVLDIHELAEFLRVTTGTIEQYLDEIPCFELGGKLLFSRRSIEDWIERREKYFHVQIAGFERGVQRIQRIVKPGGRRWKAQRNN